MARSVDSGHSWMRAACAVHEQEQRRHHLITEMSRLAEALVIRMKLLGHGRARDGVLSAAIQLRDRLAAEARVLPLLQRWQVMFDKMARDERPLDADATASLERDLEQWGLPEEPSHQLPLRFATG